MAIQERLKVKRSENLIWFFVAIALLLGCITLTTINFSHKQDSIIVVEKIDFQQSITSDGDNVHSEYQCMIYSENGIYTIAQRGLFSHPELIGKLHEGDTVSITTRGYNFPLIGIYPVIVKAE